MQFANAFRNGLKDVAGGIGEASVYTMLASNDIARRYKRSRIGQLWLTLSMAAMVVGMGLVFSQIFKVSAESFIPFLAVGIIIWSFIQQTLNESCNTFMENEGFVRQLSLPRFTYMMRVLLRNIFVATHNFAIIPLVFIFYLYPVNVNALFALPGLIIVVLNVAWMGYVLAIVSARFRDVPQIVQNLLQVMFFLTPIMYRPNQLSPDHPLIAYNPFSALISLVREPLLGHPPSGSAYVFSIVMLLIGSVVALALAGRYSRRIVYWL